jgi:hypothetical protein
LGLDRAWSVAEFQANSGVEAPRERRNVLSFGSSSVVFFKQASVSIGREHLSLAPLGAPQDTLEQSARLLFAQVFDSSLECGLNAFLNYGNTLPRLRLALRGLLQKAKALKTENVRQ